MSDWKDAITRERQPLHVEAVGKYTLHANLLRARMEYLNIHSADDVAAQAECSVQALRKVLAGKHDNPQLESLVRICQVLGLQLNEVVTWD